MEKKYQFKISGIHCVSCANIIKTKLESRGASEIHVSQAEQIAFFKHIDQTQIPDIIKELEQSAYQVINKDLYLKHDQADHDHSDDQHQHNGLTLKLLLCIVLTLPLLAHMISDLHILHDRYFQLICSTPVFIIGLIQFGKSALGALRSGTTNMDVLILLSICSAYFFSLVLTLLGIEGSVYFESAASITSIVLLGNALEARAIAKASSALSELKSLMPETASRESKDGKFETVKLSQLKVGDTIQARTGERIAADGVVISGTADVNLSLITGESLPEKIIQSDRAIAGSIVLSGSILIKISEIGEDSSVGKIIDLVRQAQANRPSLQKIGDQVSAIFVPLVASIAIITFLSCYYFFALPFAESLVRAITILVIACPCALGLATPTAVMVGIGLAAKNSTIVKGGDTLERLAQVKSIAFDKTGTITDASYAVQIENLKCTKSEAINILYSLERHSTHPIAKSIVQAFKDQASPIELNNIQEQVGVGIFAKDNDQNLLSITRSTSENSRIELKRNAQVLCQISINENLRSGVKEVIDKLNQLGINCYLISGDDQIRVQEVAKQLAFKEVYAERSPQQKLELIKQLSNAGILCYVGDGVNDAPSLSAADISISLSGASNVAQDAAQIIMLNSRIDKIDSIIMIAKITVKTIKQNLFWAFSYNLIAIPLAASGLLSPTFASFAMVFSDVFVIGNSLRVKYRPLLKQ